MVSCGLDAIKATTKMQVNNIIFLLSCCLFCVYDIGFISMVIVKEIISTCVICALTVFRTYQKQSLAIIAYHSSVYNNNNEGVQYYLLWSLVSDDSSYVQYFYSDYDTQVRIAQRYFVTSLLDQAYLVDTYKVRIRLLTYKTRI